MLRKEHHIVRVIIATQPNHSSWGVTIYSLRPRRSQIHPTLYFRFPRERMRTRNALLENLKYNASAALIGYYLRQSIEKQAVCAIDRVYDMKSRFSFLKRLATNHRV